MSEQPKESQKSKVAHVKDLLVAYKNWIGIGILVAFVAFAWLQPEIAIPRKAKLVVVGLVVAVIVGWAPATRIVKWLHNPDYRYIFVPGLSGDEMALYRLTPERWEQVDVIEGNLYEVPNTVAPVYEAERFDPEQNLAKGTWRGSASDVELLEHQEKIDEVREELEPKARRSLTLRIRIGAIVRDAVSNIAGEILKEYEQRTIMKGDLVGEAIDSAVEDMDVGAALAEQNERQTTPDDNTINAQEALEALGNVTRSNQTEVAPDGGQQQRE